MKPKTEYLPLESFLLWISCELLLNLLLAVSQERLKYHIIGKQRQEFIAGFRSIIGPPSRVFRSVLAVEDFPSTFSYIGVVIPGPHYLACQPFEPIFEKNFLGQGSRGRLGLWGLGRVESK